MDKISAMENELVARGFLQKPKSKGRKNKKVKKAKKTMKKKQKRRDIEAQNGSAAEESED